MKRTVILCALIVSTLVGAQGTSAGAALDRLIAPPSVCAHQADFGARTAVQLGAMRCLTNFARARQGEAPLRGVGALDRAAAMKSADILRCDEFSHVACGREFTFWMERVGYLDGGCATAGENIAWGTGSLGSARHIFSAWIHSPGHRRNILQGAFRDLGIGLRVGGLDGNPGAHVWTQQFGAHC